MIYKYSVLDSELANAYAALSLCRSYKSVPYEWNLPGNGDAVDGATGKFKSVVILVDAIYEEADLPLNVKQVLGLYGTLTKVD